MLWRRFFAYGLDQLVILLCFWGIRETNFLPLPPLWESHVGDYGLMTQRISFELVFIFVASGWFYAGFLECSPLQATVGKMLFRLYVADKNGEKISLAQSALRQLSSLLIVLMALVIAVDKSFWRSTTGSSASGSFLRTRFPQDVLTGTKVLSRLNR